MYRLAHLLSPSRVQSSVIKKGPWGGRGLLTKTHLLATCVQNRVASSGCVRAKASKNNFDLKNMEGALREITRDIWVSLGPGYSESVYHAAFEVALRNRLINYETERIIPVFYAGQNVGNVRADLIIDRQVVVELKSVSRLIDAHRIQVRNYLSLLGLHEGYLINFPDKNGPLEFEDIKLCVSPPTEVRDKSSPKFGPEHTTSPDS